MSAVTLFLVALLGQQPAPPAPQPFPRPSAPKPATEPARPAGQQPPPAPAAAATTGKPANENAPAESTLGVSLYPGAQFLSSYDAGRGQRFYLFGTTASFADVVAYYRNVLKQRGELIFDAPATHQFDVGRFREDTMAFPPGVTIKDFQSQLSQGYPNPRLGAQPAHFPTVIQVVPVTPEGR